MTPEQQIQEARRLETTPVALWNRSPRIVVGMLADLADRLVAERDEARQDAEDSAQLAYEANEREKVLERREAALLEAAERVVADKLIVDDGCDIAHLDSSIEALAAVLAAAGAAGGDDG